MNDTDKTDLSGLWETAQTVFPGGVNASARFNKSMGRSFLVKRGQGSIIVDYEGREFIDLNMSHGASLLGYGNTQISNAILQSVNEGILCSHEMPHQIHLASKIISLIASAEMVRFCGTGTEANMHAVRLARAYTKKDVIIKFEGHFHGYGDYLAFSKRPSIEQAGTEDAPIPQLETSGIPAGINKYIIVLPFNNYDVLENVIKNKYHDIAAVIMEPVNYNSGTILPLPDFLKKVRELTTKYNILLIFDEILSGFQTGTDCMQGYFDIMPDISTVGKALGGGLPLSALVGRKEIMQTLSPLGKAMHSGTYIAHPTLILASLAFLDVVDQDGFYPTIIERCNMLAEGFRAIFRKNKVEVKVQSLGTRFSLLFGIPEEKHVSNYRDVASNDSTTAHKFYSLMLKQGIYFHPSWHHGISAAHTDEQIHIILNAAECVARDYF